MLKEGDMFLTDREQIIVTKDNDGDGVGDDAAGDLTVTEKTNTED